MAVAEAVRSSQRSRASIGPRSRVSLDRLVITEHARDYSVRRFGTGDGVVTGRHGVEAVRLLERGLTVGEVEDRLAASGARGGLDVLLAALDKAGMIRAVDGVSVGAGPRRRELAAWWRYEGYPRLWNWTFELAGRFSLGVLEKALAVMDALYVNPNRQALLDVMAANMAGAFPERSRRELRRLAAKAFDEKVRVVRRRHVGIQAGRRISEGTLEEARRALDWYLDRVTVEGLEHLREALGQGKGVILCGYHFAFILAIPFVLARLGYAVTCMGMVQRDYDERFYDGLERRLVELGHAPFRMLPKLDLGNMASLIRLLGQGRIVLLFGDAYLNTAERPELMRYLGNELKLYRPSQISTPLLGGTVAANRGLGWLHEQTGAPVVPVALFRDGWRRDRLVLRPPLPRREEGSAAERIVGLVRATYAELETLVRQRPEQWWYWKSLHRMQTDRDPGRTEPTGLG